MSSFEIITKPDENDEDLKRIQNLLDLDYKIPILYEGKMTYLKVKRPTWGTVMEATMRWKASKFNVFDDKVVKEDLNKIAKIDKENLGKLITFHLCGDENAKFGDKFIKDLLLNSPEECVKRALDTIRKWQDDQEVPEELREIDKDFFTIGPAVMGFSTKEVVQMRQVIKEAMDKIFGDKAAAKKGAQKKRK
jgi:hypothetical protein